jgi:hypothetical protein
MVMRRAHEPSKTREIDTHARRKEADMIKSSIVVFLGQESDRGVNGRERGNGRNQQVYPGGDICELCSGIRCYAEGVDLDRLRSGKHMRISIDHTYKVHSDFGRQGRTGYYKSQMLIGMQSPERGN